MVVEKDVSNREPQTSAPIPDPEQFLFIFCSVRYRYGTPCFFPIHFCWTDNGKKDCKYGTLRNPIHPIPKRSRMFYRTYTLILRYGTYVTVAPQ